MDNYSVFLNCPFDRKYKILFDAMIFTIMDCGFVPRCTLEESDTSKARLKKIQNLIAKCRYGIHDISRVETTGPKSLPRFNMPFELGLFHGAMVFGNEAIKDKMYIVLEKKKYRYLRFFSDIKGMDIHQHKNDVAVLIRVIRDWLATKKRRLTIPGGDRILSKYMLFKQEYYPLCKNKGLLPREMTFIDYVNIIGIWLRKYKQ